MCYQAATTLWTWLKSCAYPIAVAASMITLVMGAVGLHHTMFHLEMPMEHKILAGVLSTTVVAISGLGLFCAYVRSREAMVSALKAISVRKVCRCVLRLYISLCAVCILTLIAAPMTWATISAFCNGIYAMWPFCAFVSRVLFGIAIWAPIAWYMGLLGVYLPIAFFCTMGVFALVDMPAPSPVWMLWLGAIYKLPAESAISGADNIIIRIAGLNLAPSFTMGCLPFALCITMGCLSLSCYL